VFICVRLSSKQEKVMNKLTLVFFLLVVLGGRALATDRSIEKEVIVKAPLAEVWKA
jgi:hypothetical protein